MRAFVVTIPRLRLEVYARDELHAVAQAVEGWNAAWVRAYDCTGEQFHRRFTANPDGTVTDAGRDADRPKRLRRLRGGDVAIESE